MIKILLLSGGLDSVTLLHDSKPDKCIFFNYNQKAIEAERLASKYYCDLFNIELVEIDISDVFKHSTSSLIVKNKLPYTVIKDELNNHTQIEPNDTAVEFRNGVFLSIAISYALQIQEECEILYGAIQSRGNFYDCSHNFLDSYNSLAMQASNNKIRILAPYIDKGKDEVYHIGKTLNIDYSKSHSCYQANTCGLCPACIDKNLVEGIDVNYSRTF